MGSRAIDTVDVRYCVYRDKPIPREEHARGCAARSRARLGAQRGEESSADRSSSSQARGRSGPVTSTWCVLTSRMRAPRYPDGTRRQELARPRLVLPTLNRVSRGLSRRAPPAARGARGARRRHPALSRSGRTGRLVGDVPSYLDFRP